MVSVIYPVKASTGAVEATMRVTREKAAENRGKIVAAASRLFRERGLDGVGLDAIMEAAGLTHGGFYRHFASKDDLAAEAVAQGLAATAERTAPVGSLADYADSYLSPDHRDSPGTGCVLAALGSDIARHGPGARRALTESVRRRIALFTVWLGGKAPDRQQAVATLAGMVGALVLARAVDDPNLSAEILAAGRAAFGGGAPAPSGPDI
jgi:TetR/AcrR family transcriptional repressor of nem operon